MTTSGDQSTVDAQQQDEVYAHLLKCVKEIGSCPKLATGDILWKVAYEILPGGYEYAVCRRIPDNAVIKVRVDHLEECFEVIEVPIEDDYYKLCEYVENGGLSATTSNTTHVRRYL